MSYNFSIFVHSFGRYASFVHAYPTNIFFFYYSNISSQLGSSYGSFISSRSAADKYNFFTHITSLGFYSHLTTGFLAAFTSSSLLTGVVVGASSKILGSFSASSFILFIISIKLSKVSKVSVSVGSTIIASSIISGK